MDITFLSFFGIYFSIGFLICFIDRLCYSILKKKETLIDDGYYFFPRDEVSFTAMVVIVWPFVVLSLVFYFFIKMMSFLMDYVVEKITNFVVKDK